MIIIAQVLLVSLVVLAMGYVILRFRQRKVGIFSFLLWVVLWSVGAVVIVFPNSSAIIARFLGIGRGVDFVLYLSVILILYLLFRVYVRLEQVDREVTLIVRTLALRQASLAPSDDEHERTSPHSNPKR